ncbi:MAG: AAA family ATPase [Candidatus Azambacteria bacterium]|nr:AAA family ATPase [Candidatus Azambacteria bacterium]
MKRVVLKTPKQVILTITGASGVGKTTIIKKLLETRPDVKLIKSWTTRGPRESDLPGEYEYNVPAEEMQILEKDFFKIFNAHGNSYGTLKKSVVEAFLDSEPRILILVPEAVEAIRDYFSKYDVYLERIVSFYVLSPGEEELRRRLSGRNETDIQKRIDDCKKWDDAAIASDIPYIFLSNNKSVSGIDEVVGQMRVFL